MAAADAHHGDCCHSIPLHPRIDPAMSPTETVQASPAASIVQPAILSRAAQAEIVYRQRFVPHTGNLKFLSCGEFSLSAGAASVTFCRPEEESLLFMWKARATVDVGGGIYELAPYDTLYVPRGAAFRLHNPGTEPAVLVHCSAPADHVHTVFHSRFAEFSRREDRIRRLSGKDVYLMFDVGEAADKLVAGYTFFQPMQRSWPPHNHTDQEEVYIFIKGHGSMEVYTSLETLSFVHNVNEGDLVTIPMLNYHPVFSQDDPLEFIWCIAGERYWVGDKNKSFMTGTGDAITT
jgi:mannose-6-phosphate isomerase-like protein (cupin superfamily)